MTTTLLLLSILIGWIAGSLLIRLAFLIFGIDDRFCINIYLKKPDRFLIKVNPIYTLFQYEADGDYYIKKYSLGYKHDTLNGVLFFFVPFPIYFFEYRYIANRWAFFACGKEDISTFNSDLKTVYEKKISEDSEIQLKNKKREMEIEIKITKLNEIFTENYEN